MEVEERESRMRYIHVQKSQKIKFINKKMEFWHLSIIKENLRWLKDELVKCTETKSCYGGWRNCSAARSTCCSYREPRFGGQHAQGDPQTSVTLLTSLGAAHLWYVYAHICM